MSVGSGITWDETNPQQSTEASTIDSYERDIRIGTRIRMQWEHWWPSSQTGTAQAGQHTYLTFQQQTAFPGFINNNSGTSLQTAGIWVDQTNNIWYTPINSTGTPNYQLMSCTGHFGGKISGLLGSYTSTAFPTVTSIYQATGDCIVTFSMELAGANCEAYIGTASPPSTAPIVTQYVDWNGGNFTLFVPNGLYIQFIPSTIPGSNIYGPYVLPLGVNSTA